MCFVKKICKGLPHLEAKIATRPIRVLKVGHMLSDEFTKRGFLSVVYPCLYIPGHIKTQYCSIRPLLRQNDHLGVCYMLIERGFHSYRSIYANYLNSDSVDLLQEKNWNQYINPHSIGIFEIPTGSIYYSEGNLFVSDAIKLIEVITSAQEWKKANFKPELIL